MRDLPVSSAKAIWTDKGLKIVSTDSCGDMIDMSSFIRPAPRRSRNLPESLLRLTAHPTSPHPPAPKTGRGANPLA